MKEREALKLALEALEDIVSAVDTPYRLLKPYHSEIDSVRKLIPAIKEALAQPELCKYGQEPKSCTSSPMDCQCALDATFAQPEQEPVGQLLEEAYGRGQVMWFNKPDDFSMLYTTPPQRKPLTDEQIDQIESLMTDLAEAVFYREVDKVPLIRKQIIEAAHGIKE